MTDLYAGYLSRAPDGPGYDGWMNALNSGSSRADVRHGFAYSQEFQNDLGHLCATAGMSGGIKYVLSDIQGSVRAVMNNNGSNSAIVARHDYLPFGEEIFSGVGLRSSSQGFGANDTNRHKYGLTERDDATGLDHTWWRKYESTAGRWTSPDPYNGSATVVDPQSFNRYSYVENDPVNVVDPTGLLGDGEGALWRLYGIGINHGTGGSGEGAATEAEYHQRVRNTLDALAATAAYRRGGPNDPTYLAIMDRNKTLYPIVVLSKAEVAVLALITRVYGQAAGDQARFNMVTHLTGLSAYILDSEYNASDRTFKVSFTSDVGKFLASSPYFAGSGPALLHRDIGDWDYRSYTDLTGGLSMQVVLGNDLSKSYADFDRYNPYQDVYSLIRHNAPIIWHRIRRIF